MPVVYVFLRLHGMFVGMVQYNPMIQSLREAIADAEKKKIAIGHFNISNIETLWGIFYAARSLNVPVIIGTSEGERGFVGIRQAVALVRSLRDEFDYPIYLNADHMYSFEKVKEAIDAGYDAAIFDGTELPFEENARIAKQCVDYARRVATAEQRDILIEGEIGFIGKSSKILDAIPEGVEISAEHLTKPEELASFVKETGVDLVAPAVGNLHGMLRSGKNPRLDIARIRELRVAGGVPLVLHGGSGTRDEDFTAAIEAGVSIIHINTEIRVAYRKALMLALQEDPDEIAPYRYLKGAMQGVQHTVHERLRLFNRLS